MRSIITGIAALMAVSLASIAPASACELGQTIKISGKMSRVFLNAAGTWTYVVDSLIDGSFDGCKFTIGTGGTATDTPWMYLTVRKKPAGCTAGSPISATIKVIDFLPGFAFETVSASCR